MGEMPGKNRRILLIDDNRAFTERLGEQLDAVAGKRVADVTGRLQGVFTVSWAEIDGWGMRVGQVIDQ